MGDRDVGRLPRLRARVRRQVLPGAPGRRVRRQGHGPRLRRVRRDGQDLLEEAQVLDTTTTTTTRPPHLRTRATPRPPRPHLRTRATPRPPPSPPQATTTTTTLVRKKNPSSK